MLATQFNTVPAPSNALYSYSLFFTADSALTALTFTDYASNPTFNTDGYIDNAKVSAVPERSPLALVGLALASVKLLRRRFQRAKA